MKADIVKYTLYTIIFFFLHFVEKASGINAFAIPFFFALVFSKQNVIILSPIFIISGMVMDFGLWKLLYLGVPVAITLITLFIHYKISKRPTSIHIAVYNLLSYVPMVVLESKDTFHMLTGICGAVLSIPVLFISITILYAILKKKLNYSLSVFERLSFLSAIAVLGFGIGYLDIYFFRLYDFLGVLLILIAPSMGLLSAVEVAIALGIGGVIHSAPSFAVIVAYGVFTMIFPREHAYFGGVLGIGLQALLTLFGLLGADYFSLIAPGVATLIILALPLKLKRKLHDRFSHSEGSITRALVNKNRADTREKLTNLSESLHDIGAALASVDEGVELNQLELAREVVARACKRCSHYQNCKKCLGGNSTEIVIQELMGSAIELGKASILDASPFLSSRCINLNGIIVKANEVLYEKREEGKKDENIKEGRRLLREQVEGLAEILNELALDTGAPIKYDINLEKRLKDAFNDSGVSVTELIALDDGRLCIELSERDVHKTKVREIVSRVMGSAMWIYNSKPSVNGRVSTFWEKEPRYRVAYGERVSAASDSGSGDREAVVRLNSHKVMLCLSDGMGHGKEAQDNSSSAMSLIQSLYKAGFEHLTVLRSVGALLKVRNKEEFNAIDIAVIDTATGDVDIIKQGAREGYIITSEGLEELPCGSLPLGIVEGASPITLTRNLTPRDFIVMFSDGVIDGIGKENLEALLLKTDTRNPDEICSIVMENVEKLSKEERDDCSMICARLF